LAADIKSHVLRRDEKGFLGIPFKRLLLGGVVGGMVLILSRFAVGNWAFVLAAASLALTLALTAPRGGLPLWQRWLYRVRGSLMLAVERNPASLAGRLGEIIEVPDGLVALDGAHLFAPPAAETEADMTEWVTFVRADEADHDSGLVFMEKPLEESC
jgi:hypothetical protein